MYVDLENYNAFPRMHNMVFKNNSFGYCYVFIFSCKWFEPRSISSLLSVIVRVSIVLKRTVVVDND